jgi:hypothetical protein
MGLFDCHLRNRSMGNNFEHALHFSDLFCIIWSKICTTFSNFFVSFLSYLAEFSACCKHCTVRAPWRAVALDTTNTQVDKRDDTTPANMSQ